MISCSHLCNKHETCSAFAFDPALKCSFVNGTQNLVKTSKKNPEALKLGIANYPSLSLVPHFLILHDSNKLEDYSLDPVISPPIEYGSWPIEIFPPASDPSNQRARGFASVLMSDMTINVRQYEQGSKNYFHWNFEKNSVGIYEEFLEDTTSSYVFPSRYRKVHTLTGSSDNSHLSGNALFSDRKEHLCNDS